MSRLLTLLLVLSAIAANASAADEFWTPLRDGIQRYLARPYVWGSAGLKSFDCSGFVWRVMYDNGILIKRTTARKLYMSLPAVPDSQRWNFGNVVFFDNLKHCGIVEDRRSFYHAQSIKGTNLSTFDPYWRRKVCGFRGVRKP